MQNKITIRSAKKWKGDPPSVITLKRKGVRYVMDGKKVALYYSTVLDRYISVPYDTDQKSKEDVTISEEVKSTPKPKAKINPATVLNQIKKDIEQGQQVNHAVNAVADAEKKAAFHRTIGQKLGMIDQNAAAEHSEHSKHFEKISNKYQSVIHKSGNPKQKNTVMQQADTSREEGMKKAEEYVNQWKRDRNVR